MDIKTAKVGDRFPSTNRAGQAKTLEIVILERNENGIIFVTKEV